MAFDGRGLGPQKSSKERKQAKLKAGEPTRNIFAANGIATEQHLQHDPSIDPSEAFRQRGGGGRGQEEEQQWESAMSARHRRRGAKEDKGPRSYVVSEAENRNHYMEKDIILGKKKRRK